MNHGRVKALHCCKNVYGVKMATAPLTQVSPLLPGHLVHVCSEGMWGPACLQGHIQFKNRLGVTFPPHTAFSQQSPFIFVSISSFIIGVRDSGTSQFLGLSPKFQDSVMCRLHSNMNPICACMLCIEIQY